MKDLGTALVVYHSMFGNTEKIARALVSGLKDVGIDTDIARVDAVNLEELGSIDLLCVGTPVHAWNISKPVREFLGRLRGVEGLSGKKAFAFDTKFKSRLAGSAGGKVEKKLKSLGFVIAKPAKSAIVLGKEGPLEANAEATFKQIGSELAGQM
ncbi:MAG: flavodoxin family protein [Candidatus Hodarchaeota archaeon]